MVPAETGQATRPRTNSTHRSHIQRIKQVSQQTSCSEARHRSCMILLKQQQQQCTDTASRHLQVCHPGSALLTNHISPIMARMASCRHDVNQQSRQQHSLTRGLGTYPSCCTAAEPRWSDQPKAGPKGSGCRGSAWPENMQSLHLPS